MPGHGAGRSRFDRDGPRLSAGLGVEIRRMVATLLFIWPPNMATWYLVEVKKCDAIIMQLCNRRAVGCVVLSIERGT